MEGVLVEGRRRTTTYPTNSLQNDPPFSTFEEEWFSDELKIAIFHRSSDPRLGDRITRITGFRRSEPDPLLFEVPSDYTIKDQPGLFPFPLLPLPLLR